MQAALGALALAAGIGAPPRHGEMLVLPLFRADIADTANWVTERGGRITHVAANGRNIIVYGWRDRLIWPALEHRALLIRVPDSLCTQSR